jgi:Asp/Glu/hydantoin racemase
MSAARIALIHATPLAIEPVNRAFERWWPDAGRMTLLDDSLSVDRQRDGVLTPKMVGRFETLARYGRDAGCHAILFTCSAFGPAIEAAGRACGLPTLKPNEAMFKQAIALGGRAALIATFEPSIAPMRDEFDAMSSAAGRAGVPLQTFVVPGAMQALAAGDAAAHDAAIARCVARITVDVVMLAQFSMAAAQPAVQAVTAARVLTSPDCAVQALRAALDASSGKTPT